MKSNTKLSILALSLLVPAVSVPLFVQAASNSSSTNTTAKHEGKMMGGRGQNRMTETERTTFEAERTARQAAVDKAIETNDYSAWVTAVGTNSQMAKEVTSDEFSTFVEAHKLMRQAQEKMTSIGVTHGGGRGW